MCYDVYSLSEERDREILVTHQFNELSVSSQCAKAPKKAMRVLGMVRTVQRLGQRMSYPTVQEFCQTTYRICNTSLVTLPQT